MRTIGIPSVLLSCVLAVGHAQAMDKEQALEMMRGQLEDSCATDQVSQCLDVDPSQCPRAAEATISACGELLSTKGPSEAFSDCVSRNMREELGVSKAELNACQASAESKERTPRSPEEARKEAMEKADKVAEQFARMAEGTEDEVTLPVYPNHKMTAHHRDMSNFKPNGKRLGDAAVSMAMMTTPDSVADVVAFYEDRLDGFEQHRSSEENVTFVKGVPVETGGPDLEELYVHEHVSVYRLSGETRIEIGYRPES
ncbi:hypothetical protein [Arhodomonas sp. AD133]|uniref:hypothetical protein n=1 Tax=Arhodomonas sp. AD133 TaxID=3415009 RepID=UPI003EB75005